MLILQLVHKLLKLLRKPNGARKYLLFFSSAFCCLAIPFTIWHAAVLCPTLDPIKASLTGNPATIEEATKISGFIRSSLHQNKEIVNYTSYQWIKTPFFITKINLGEVTHNYSVKFHNFTSSVGLSWIFLSIFLDFVAYHIHNHIQNRSSSIDETRLNS